MKNKKKYAYGTVKQYLETPQEAMAENEIAKIKAKEKAVSNPWANGLSVLGNMAINYGTSQMSKGIAEGDGADGKGLDGFLAGSGMPLMDILQMGGNASQFMAMGGDASGQIEAEGEEMIETPDGEVGEIKGPKHEQGGVDLNVEPGTTIYSDRIMIEGKSIADRKKARENKLKALEEKILKSKGDKILKNTFKKTKEALDLEEAKDLNVQDMISFVAGTQGKAMFGLNGMPGLPDLMSLFTQTIPDFSKMTGTTDDIHNPQTTEIDLTSAGKTPGINPTEQEDINFDINPGKSSRMTTEEDLLPGQSSPNVNTFGNTVGLLGNMISTFGPYKNTLKSRATDTPNINAFEGFGEDALDVNEETQGYVDEQRDLALKDIDRASQGSKRANRNSARSVNTQRALDLSSDMAANKSRENVYADFSKQMMQILGQKASLENQQDSVVMQGEKERDMNDRRDKDNFYTQLAQDIATMGQGIQQTGKDLNQVEQQKAISKILSQLNKYGVTFDENYNLQNPSE